MPGKKDGNKNSYITPPVTYRTVSEADATAADLPLISYPQAQAGVGAYNTECRIGEDNTLIVLFDLQGGGMNLTPSLWRVLGGVAFLLDEVVWGAMTQSTMRVVEDLPAGDYVITLTGAFNDNLCVITEQHSE